MSTSQQPVKPTFHLKDVLSLALRYLIGGAITYYIFTKYDFNLSTLSPLFTFKNLVFLIFLKFWVYFFVSLRWKMILKELDIQIAFPKAFLLSMLGLFFSYVLPGNMTSDIGKSYYSVRMLGHPSKVITSIVIDRIAGLLSLLVLLLVSGLYLFYSQREQIQHLLDLVDQDKFYLICVVLLLLCVVAGVASVFLFRQKKFAAVKDIVFKISSPAFLLKIFVFSVFSHLSFVYFLYCVGVVLGLEQIDFLGSMVVFPLGSLSMIIPLTPGSVGVGQVVYNFLFNAYTGIQGQGGSVAFTGHQVIDILFVLIGLGYLLHVTHKKIKKHH